MKYNCVLQWMLVHRDPKRAANIAPLTKGQSWTDFCVQLMLGTYPGPVWNKEPTQNVFGPCRSPFHGNEEWHLLQQLSVIKMIYKSNIADSYANRHYNWDIHVWLNFVFFLNVPALCKSGHYLSCIVKITKGRATSTCYDVIYQCFTS